MTTNVELNVEAKKLKLKNYRGTLMIDDLANLNPRVNECAIVNLDTNRGDGTHWVAFWKNKHEKIYFDSFGAPPDKRLVKYVKSPILYSTYQIQQFNDENCGQWCLYVLNELNLGKDFIDIILDIING
jgi:hypothetical protein